MYLFIQLLYRIDYQYKKGVHPMLKIIKIVKEIV